MALNVEFARFLSHHRKILIYHAGSYVRVCRGKCVAYEFRAQRIAEWARGNPQPPVRIEIHPTDRCNLRCRFCWQVTADTQDYSWELSDEKWLSIVHEAGRMGVKEWIVSGGGEVFMRPKLGMELMRTIKSYGMWGQLTTNGTLMTEENVRDIVQMGWDQVQISLDGPDAATQDYLRAQKNVFSRVINTAKRLSRYKKQLNSERPYVGFNSIINRKNYTRLAEHIELAYDVGFQLVYFEPLYPGYVRGERLELNEAESEEMQPHIQEAKKRADELGVATNVERFLRTDLMDKADIKNLIHREAGVEENPFMSAPCYQPWFLMAIKGSGLAGCCSSFEVGEKIHDKTLAEVWYGDTFNKLRASMLEKQLPEYCEKCSIYVVMDNKEIRKAMLEHCPMMPRVPGVSAR